MIPAGKLTDEWLCESDVNIGHEMERCGIRSDLIVGQIVGYDSIDRIVAIRNVQMRPRQGRVACLRLCEDAVVLRPLQGIAMSLKFCIETKQTQSQPPTHCNAANVCEPSQEPHLLPPQVTSLAIVAASW